jgi:hypothetical protein
MGSTGALFLDDKQNDAAGPFYKSCKKSPDEHGVIWRIGASFLGPRFFVWGA